MKLSYAVFAVFLTAVIPSAFGEGSCSAQGGFDCPVLDPPPPKCPQGHSCPYKFGINKAGDTTIFQGDTPIALIPKANVHWNPAITKGLIEKKEFSSNGLLVEITKDAPMKFGSGAKFKPVTPDSYDEPLPVGPTNMNEANPPKKK